MHGGQRQRHKQHGGAQLQQLMKHGHFQPQHHSTQGKHSMQLSIGPVQSKHSPRHFRESNHGKTAVTHGSWQQPE